jgi:DNA-binding MarR family transcriptional regulator
MVALSAVKSVFCLIEVDMKVFASNNAEKDDYERLAFIDTAESLRDGMRKFSDLAGEKTSAKLVLAFVTIASRPEGLSATECADAVGMTLTGIQRVAARLGNVDRTGEPGMQLIETTKDRDDARRTLYRLTPKGREVWAQMASILMGKILGMPPTQSNVLRLEVTDAEDRKLFEEFGVDPEHAFVFGARRLAEVVAVMKQHHIPRSLLRVSPFGGFALTFDNETQELTFFKSVHKLR